MASDPAILAEGLRKRYRDVDALDGFDPGWGGDSWASQHSLVLAVVWPLLLTAVFLPLAVRRYRRLSD